jgi:16S rRNA G1207 methylase RsmC
VGNLAATLSEHANATRPTRCTVGILLMEKLDDIDSQALRNALDDAGMGGEQIASALRDEGHEMAGQTVQRHRRRHCGCWRASA